MRKEVNLLMREGKKIYLKEFVMKSQRNLADYFFKMNYIDDPSEIIFKGIFINEICENITPKINGIVTKKDRIFFSCEIEQELYQKSKFSKDECYKCGRFVGMVHSHKFSYFGNLYNFRLDNSNFEQYFNQIYNFCLENKMIHNSQINPFLSEKYGTKIRKFGFKYSTLVSLNPACEDILFDRNGNIFGYKFVDKIVLAFPELELLSWKSELGIDFKYFIEGYKQYSNYDEKDDDIVSIICDAMNLCCR